MRFSRPILALAPPLALLGLGVAALVQDPWGLASAVRGWVLRAMTSGSAEMGKSGVAALRPDYALHVEVGGVAVAGLLLLLLMVRTRSYWSALFVAASVMVALYASQAVFMQAHLFVDALTPSLILLAVFGTACLMRLRELQAARAALRLAFSDSLPQGTIEKIVRRPELLSQDGETRTITYLVCGVRGLPELAASLQDDPRAFTNIMQLVMTPLMDQALAHGGTIDRMTADGFAAFWNAPLDDADHALHACEAASVMSALASQVSEQIALDRPAMATLEIGIGVATGDVIAGGFGGAGRMGYSVHGKVVQMAAKIQALSHQYGPAVIVAESTEQDAARGFAFLEVDYIATGMGAPPMRLFAMLGNPVLRASPKFRALIAFHDHIFASLRRQQWAKARALIAQCRNLSGASQKLYDLHLNRIGYFETNPPGRDWDGAFRPILK